MPWRRPNFRLKHVGAKHQTKVDYTIEPGYRSCCSILWFVYYIMLEWLCILSSIPLCLARRTSRHKWIWPRTLDLLCAHMNYVFLEPVYSLGESVLSWTAPSFWPFWMILKTLYGTRWSPTYLEDPEKLSILGILLVSHWIYMDIEHFLWICATSLYALKCTGLHRYQTWFFQLYMLHYILFNKLKWNNESWLKQTKFEAILSSDSSKIQFCHPSTEYHLRTRGIYPTDLLMQGTFSSSGIFFTEFHRTIMNCVSHTYIQLTCL